MTDTPNRANARLRDSGYAFGTSIGCVADPTIVVYAATAGFDFVTIDMEHSSFGWEAVGELIQMARAHGLTPVVRPEQATRESVGRLLDLGALGIMVHDVETREQVDELASWTGGSKFAGRTGSAEGARGDLTVIVQLESAEALSSIDQILAGGAVDVVNIGRGDLTASLGHGDDRWHPEVLQAIDEIVAGCRRNGVYPGMGAVSRMDQEEVDDLIARGLTWITFGTDKLILRKGLAHGRKLLEAATAAPGAGR